MRYLTVNNRLVQASNQLACKPLHRYSQNSYLCIQTSILHMLSTCPTCDILSLSDQEGGRDHNTASGVPHYPVPLSSTDHRQLQTDIVDLENDITLLDHQIRRLRASLSDLRRVRRKRKKSQLERVRKSSRSSIWSLPVELIVEIITLAADDDNGDIYHGVPWVLSYSCRLWRNIVLSTPAT